MGRRAATSLLIRIDPAARGELQRQVYQGIRRAILDGVVRPGARLPSSRELAADLRVSRTTTILAVDQLTAEGYVVSRPGSGTFVARELPDERPRSTSPKLKAAGRHPPLSKRGASLAAAPPSALRLPGPPRPFRIGVPALDAFPMPAWSRLMARRLRSTTTSQLDYGEAAGFPPLRQAIAEHVRAARGTECDPEQVVVVAGAQRAVAILCQLLLDPGDAAWMEEPGYPGARSALLAAGARILPVPVDAEGLDVVRAIRRAPRARLAYVTPSHQFPLGVTLSLRRRQELLNWARRSSAWVIEDDYDSDFRYGARPIPCLHGLDADGRVIYVGSFSKTLFPGLRLGFMIVPRDLADAVTAARRASDLHPPRLEQAVLADFMQEGHYERHLRRVRALCKERLAALVEAARRHCGGALRIRPARTGLHVVADLAGAEADRVFAEAAARGVEVMPLSAYYASAPRRSNTLVLGFGGVRPDAIDDGMARLAAAIAAATLASRRPPRYRPAI